MSTILSIEKGILDIENENIISHEEAKQKISAECTLDELRAQTKKEGIEPLRIAGARKVMEGVTTLEEVLRVVPLT